MPHKNVEKKEELLNLTRGLHACSRVLSQYVACLILTDVIQKISH